MCLVLLALLLGLEHLQRLVQHLLSGLGSEFGVWGSG